MLEDPEFRNKAFIVAATLLVVGALWGLWHIVEWCRSFILRVRCLESDVARFTKYLHEENAKKLYKRLYGNRDSSIPPTPQTAAPFFLRPSSPPPIPTIDATDWDDDDDRPSATTVVKSS